MRRFLVLVQPSALLEDAHRAEQAQRIHVVLSDLGYESTIAERPRDLRHLPGGAYLVEADTYAEPLAGRLASLLEEHEVYFPHLLVVQVTDVAHSFLTPATIIANG